MPRGERLFRMLAGLMLDRFYGTVTIRMESGKVTHVETETRRVWRYQDLPQELCNKHLDPTVGRERVLSRDSSHARAVSNGHGRG